MGATTLRTQRARPRATQQPNQPLSHNQSAHTHSLSLPTNADRSNSVSIVANLRKSTRTNKRDFLIANNANVNYTSQEGTALMAATVKGNLDLVALLLKKGADPNLKNKTGITALMYAVQFKNVDIVKLLLNSGANKSLQDNEGRTAFEYAVFTKNDEIINLLKN